MSNSQEPLMRVHPRYFNLKLHDQRLPPITGITLLSSKCDTLRFSWIKKDIPFTTKFITNIQHES